MRQCKVFVHDVEAGILQETDDRQYIFTYQKGYAGAPVCIAMPIRVEPFHTSSICFLREPIARLNPSCYILTKTMTSASCWQRLKRIR